MEVGETLPEKFESDDAREQKNAFRYKNSAGLSLFKPPVLSLKTELEDRVSNSRCGSKCP